jgi:hypothetical protein
LIFEDFFTSSLVPVMNVTGANGDLLLAREVVGGRAALEVDGAVGHERDAGLRGHGVVLHRELRHAELLLHSSTIAAQMSIE